MGWWRLGENGRLPPAHSPHGSYGNKAKPKRNRDSEERQAASSPEVLPFLPGSTSSSVDLLQLLPSVFLYKGKEEAGGGGGEIHDIDGAWAVGDRALPQRVQSRQQKLKQNVAEGVGVGIQEKTKLQ